MTHHPHIHMIVPGGGISLDGRRWISSRPAFLGLVEDTPERHPQGFRATESHIKTVAWHLAPMIKGTGGRADASGFTRLSKKAPPMARRKCHVLNEIKNYAHRPQKRAFPDATRPERCIGWWLIIGRILNQPLQRLRALGILNWVRRCAESWRDRRFVLEQQTNAYAVLPDS